MIPTADFGTLNLTVNADAQSATSAINSLSSALGSLRGALGSVDISPLSRSMQSISRLTTGLANAISGIASNPEGLQNISRGITDLANAVSAIPEEAISRMERLGDALQALSSADLSNLKGLDISLPGGGTGGGSGFGSVFSAGTNGAMSGFTQSVSLVGRSIGRSMRFAASGMREIGSGFASLYDNFGKVHLGSIQVIKDLLRMGKMRFLRSLIKGLGTLVKNGFVNLAHYSSEANAVLSNFSTGAQYAGNSLAAALYPAISSVIGIFNALINVVVRAMNVINMFFSVLGGKSTYTRATRQTKDFTKATGAAGGAAKALKQELMGFDEINSLTPDGGGGGGGGGGGLDYAGMFEEAPIESWMRDAIASGDFSILGEAVADKVNQALSRIDWTKIKRGAFKAATGIATAINGFIKTISPITIGNTIAEAINTATTFVATFWNTTDWYAIGEKVKQSLVIALQRIDAKKLGEALTGKLRGLILFAYGWVTGKGAGFFTTLGTKIGEALNAAIDNIPWGEAALAITGFIGDAVTGAKLFLHKVKWGDLAANVNTFIHTALATMPWDDAADAITLVIQKAVNYMTLPETAENARLAVSKITSFLIKILSSINWAQVGAGLANIVNAIVSGINDALNGSAEIRVRDALQSFFDGIEWSAVIDLIINLGKLTIGKVISGYMLLKTLAGMLPAIAGSIGIGGTTMMLTGAAAALIIGIDIYTAITGSDEDKSDAIFNLIGKSLFGAAFGAVAVAIGASGFAVVFTVAAGIVIASKILDNTAISETEFSSDITNRIIEMGEAATTAADPILYMAGAMSELAGVNISPDMAQRALELAGVDWQNGTAGADDYSNALAVLQHMIESSNLDQWLATVSSSGETLTSVGSEIETATGKISSGADNVESSVSGLSDSLSAAESTASTVSGTMDDTAAAIEGLPSVVVLDGTALSNVESGAQNAMKAVSNLMIAFTLLKAILSSITDRNMAALSTAASNASTSVSHLKSSLSETPTKKNISVSLPNISTAQSKVDKFKKALSGIGNLTVKLTVKAGLSTQAKTFLRNLQNLDSSVSSTVSNLINASAFANGGYPNRGDLFIANEAGAEMVGRIGNRPAVANQEQIGDAIFRYMDAHDSQSGNGIDADALATAIVRGMKAAGIGSVKIGGRDIARAVNNETNRSGKPVIQF